MEPNSVDAIVTDPPYGLGFIDKDWAGGVPHEHFWREALRVAKPGAYLLAMGGARTFHRLTCSIEDDGWEIRDCLGWLYGSGFPKSHNLKGEREGWETALKPAWEPVIMARKPLDGTVATNVQKWGTGAINVDGCRVGTEMLPAQKRGNAINTPFASDGATAERRGRWPANLVHDGSDEVLELFPSEGRSTKPSRTGGHFKAAGLFPIDSDPVRHEDSGGSAARFFYCAKASRAEREAGCGGAVTRQCGVGALRDGGRGKTAANTHPTVKPLALMRYLCRLVTPPGGLILDPFMGSGTTLIAAVQEGFRAVGIEVNEEYCGIARKRIRGTLMGTEC
jgi:site-specific DNA-methyltransferase (adenine-specific)